jgi:hypothetical protein
MIDFDRVFYTEGKYVGMRWSEDQKGAMNRFLFDGLMPGGHMEAMLAHDYERALYNADTHSRTVFWATATWIRENAPELCQGSYSAVEFWCRNPELRERYRTECEKKYMWDRLTEDESL